MCQEVGHTAKECPRSQKRCGKGPTSESAKAAAKNSLQELALPGSSKPISTSSSSYLRDLREKLDHLKQTFVPPGGEDSASLQNAQPKSPPVVVVDAGQVAISSSPGAQQPEAGLAPQRDSFEFSLEVPPAAPVIPSSSGWSKPFERSVMRKVKVSLEIVVPSSTSRLGPVVKRSAMNNHNNNKINNKSTSSVPSITHKSGIKSNKFARPEVKSSSLVNRGVGQ